MIKQTSSKHQATIKQM